ncbi:hypothetical protein QSV08_04930 [Maribacter sp. BPC-D8]|uniref:hypothetical protein n=1 Tax=Maribacter sp. BPC-D8 TaxID=3053613 RepID=UPI002B45E8CB|nr:hypothetical protein [Maribacter sp. BPC-D8]WRI30586.1 hypothetical protein QSV08_04930 [Maribacter sp. BPC-D8]
MFLTIALSACSYNFSEDNFIELKLPSGEGVSIDFQNFSVGDTINSDKTIYYEIATEENQFGISTDIFVGTNRVENNKRSSSGQFSIRPNLYEDGEHNIIIVHEFSSGTGSISEQQGQETIIITETFSFYINRNPSTPPSITSAVIENGSIVVRWDNEIDLDYKEAFLHLKFPAYEELIALTPEMLLEGVYIDTKTILFPLDGNRPEDENSGSVEYSILLSSEFEEIFGAGATLASDPAWLEVKISFIDFESFSVTWPQHPLYNNLESYQISLLYSYSYDPVVFSASTMGGTEIINQPYNFGGDYFGNLFPETNYSPYIPAYRYSPILDENTLVSIPNMVQDFGKELIFNPDTGNYYFLAVKNGDNNSKIIAITEFSSDMQMIRKINLFEIDAFSDISDLEFVMDPESHNFYLDFGYRTSALTYLRQTMELDKFSLLNLREFTTEGLSGANTFQLRGDILKTWDYQSQLLTLTNVITNQVIYEVVLGENRKTDNIYLSDNGSYMIIKQDSEDIVYQITNNIVTVNTVLENRIYGYSVDIYDNILYYGAVGNTIRVVDLLNNQEVSSISYESGDNNRRISFDPLSNKIILLQYEDCFIVDRNSGKISKFRFDITKGNEGYGNTYTMWLTNNRLIHSKGIYADIE